MNANLPLSAETIVPLRSPLTLMSHLREHFEEHGAMAGAAEKRAARLGSATIAIRGTTARAIAAAPAKNTP